MNNLEAFWEKHHLLLQENYPGLTKEYLFSFFKNRNLYLVSDLLLKGYPLEYISNEKFFYEHSFYVNEDVLIPRPETEVLVEYVENYILKKDATSICDIGTGSGCIILSLALGKSRRKIKRLVGGDISEDALKVSSHNSFRLRAKSKVEWILSDRFEKIDESFDIIVSNPPYIKREKDEDLVHAQVLKNEPHIALFIKDNDYDYWFKEFFKSAYNHLNEEGLFIMEGSENHLEALSVELSNNGFKDVNIMKDLAGVNRFLIGRK